jgi:hypothetical protein
LLYFLFCKGWQIDGFIYDGMSKHKWLVVVSTVGEQVFDADKLVNCVDE